MLLVWLEGGFLCFLWIKQMSCKNCQEIMNTYKEKYVDKIT